MARDFREVEVYAQHDWEKVLSENKQETDFFVGYRKPDAPNVYLSVPMAKWAKGYSSDQLSCQPMPRRTLKVDIPALGQEFMFAAPVAELDQLHEHPVETLDISPTGNLGLSADPSDQLKVWNTTGAQVERQLQGHVLDVEVARFFPSGLVVLSAGMDMTVRVWSVQTGECARTMIGHKGKVTGLGFIDRGAEVLSCSADATIQKWNCGQGRSVDSMCFGERAGPLTDMHWDDQKGLAAVGSQSGHVYLADFGKKDEVLRLRLEDQATAVACNDRFLFAGLANGALAVVDVRTNSLRSIYRTARGRVHRLLCRGNSVIAAFANGSVALFEDPTQCQKAALEFTGADCQPVYDMAIYGDLLFTGGKDGVIRKYALPARV